jgi:1-aminocyclopropane-1-carboxylate deaminase/D-cysteine desulfhydrase-like pyridoxal-dependent ACC family enzyme
VQRIDILRRLAAVPSVALIQTPTAIDEMPRLGAAIGSGPKLYVKRDDAIPFGFGGNKVRKLQFVAAEAVARGADTLVTVGGVQSNHARATAAVAARLGMRCLIIANGTPPAKPTANALLDALLGADIEYIASRAERETAARAAVDRLTREGRNPYWIPLGASTPLGALGFVQAIGEMVGQGFEPDVIVHAASSGGTLAGIVAGCALLQVKTRVIGISADDPSDAIAGTVRAIVGGIAERLGVESPTSLDMSVDDGHVGEGYGVPTGASREAQQLAARNEALFVDHTYTAKALGALIAYIRQRKLTADQTVLFWHTGGQVGLFA